MTPPWPGPPAWPPRAPGSLFVTLEGVDGAGKTTQARALAERLRLAGREVVETREPGGTPGAEAIRELLLGDDAEPWSTGTEALLFTAARRAHVERVIAPALARGTSVVCDRFVDSTRAYQGGDRDARAFVDALHALAIGVEADATLILLLDPDAALARAEARGRADRFEARGRDFQADLAAAYRAIAEADPARCRLIDADADAETVSGRVWAALNLYVTPGAT
ncbi:MAG: dTMP kinase [Paracoccaceae bacterium]